MASPSITMPTSRRALLYVSASNPSALAMSRKTVVDNITFDLRSSVNPSTKPEVRLALRDHLSTFYKNSTTVGEVAVRINLLDGPHGEDDIKAIASLPNVDAIVIPKVESAADLLLVEDILRHAAPHRFATTNESSETEQAPRPFKLLATIDSAKGVMNLKDICSATPNLKGLLFGAEEFARNVLLVPTPDMHEMLYARSAIVTAVRAFGLESAIDAVTTIPKGAADDPDRLVRDCRNGKQFGFNGKQCVHSAQVPTVQRMFSPRREINKVKALLTRMGYSADVLDGPPPEDPQPAHARSGHLQQTPISSSPLRKGGVG